MICVTTMFELSGHVFKLLWWHGEVNSVESLKD